MDQLSTSPASSTSLTSYARRVGVAVGIVFIVLFLTGLLGTALGVFLRVLAALLIALPRQAGAQGLHRRTRLPQGLALLLVALLVVGSLVGMGWLFSTRIGGQVSELQKQLPQAVHDVQARIRTTEWGQWLANENIDFGRITGGGSAWWAGSLVFSLPLSACWPMPTSSSFCRCLSPCSPSCTALAW